MIRRVKILLRNEKPEVIMAHAKLAPYWIAKIFYDILGETRRFMDMKYTCCLLLPQPNIFHLI
jgi:hypothetical protein